MDADVAGLAILIGGGLVISYAFVCFWTSRRFATWYTGNLDAFGDKGLVFFLFACTFLLFGWLIIAIMAIHRIASNMLTPASQNMPLATAPIVQEQRDAPAAEQEEAVPQPPKRRFGLKKIAEKEDALQPIDATNRRNRTILEDEATINPAKAKPKLTLAKSARTQPRSAAETDTAASETETDRSLRAEPSGSRAKKRSRRLNLNLDSRGKLHLVPGPTERKEPHF